MPRKFETSTTRSHSPTVQSLPRTWLTESPSQRAARSHTGHMGGDGPLGGTPQGRKTVSAMITRPQAPKRVALASASNFFSAVKCSVLPSVVSTFAWIDHSEKQRRQMLEAIDLFREKDTRDELGIAGIRDTFSDMLFPGTGALQTRARYFFFVAWMYLDFAAKRISSAEIARRSRAFEISLIDRLADSADPVGTIGIQARASLQRVPSSIYWNGLKLPRIYQLSGSQADYQRSLDLRAAAAATTRKNDDGEVEGGVARAWHAGLPTGPAGFPSDGSDPAQPGRPGERVPAALRDGHECL